MSQIKISVPNDDSCALFHIGKSLIDLSSTIEGSPYWVVITQKEYDELKAFQRLEQATEDLIQAAPAMLQENNVDGSIEIHGKRKEVEVDTTSQQVESLVNTDSTGTPWDERIHSASKALNSDGTWRVRRKPKDMDEAEWGAFVQNVQDELLGQKPSDEYDDTDPLQIIENARQCLKADDDEPPITTEGDDFHTDAGVVTEQQVASFPPPPPVPQLGGGSQSTPYKLVGAGDDLSSGAGVTPQTAAITAASGGGAPVTMTFPQVMAFLTERHGRITSAQVDQIIADMGLEKITDLNTQPEHTGPFIARVKALLGE